MNGAEHRLLLPAADAVGHRHTGPHGQSNKQIDDQVGNGSGGANCRHGNTAAVSAHHHKIRRVEQQLQHTCKHNGYGVGHQRPGQRAFQHISVLLLHKQGFFSFFFQIKVTLLYRRKPEMSKNESYKIAQPP